MSRAKIDHRGQGVLTSSAQPSTDVPKRAKTRIPAKVRERRLQGKENIPLQSGRMSTSNPTLVSRSTSEEPLPDYLKVLMDTVQSAIRDRDWNRLGNLIEGISHPETGLDLPSLADHPAVKKTLKECAIDVLTAQIPPSDEQLSLTLDLLDIGADWNAKDAQGDSVLRILRRYADDTVLAFIRDEHPRFKHLFIDREGRPINPE